MKTNIKTTIRSLLMILIGICCTITAGAQILSVTDSSTGACNNDGSIFITVHNGTPPYTYTVVSTYGPAYGPVTQSTPDFTGLPQGSYSIIVSDVNGLSNITQPAYAYIYATFYAYVNVMPAICPATVGSEFIRVYSQNGDSVFSYLWSDGSTADTVLNIPLGTHYTCTVTDVRTGCVALTRDSGGMYQSSSITGTFVNTPANCTNGTATVTPAGGVSPYTFHWANGQVSAAATGLSSGYAVVTITDNIGCTAAQGTYISQAITLSTQVNSTAEHCVDANGTLSISMLNGTAPFTYHWSSGQTTAHITGLSFGYYNVSITDHNGCTAYDYGYVQTSTPIVVTTSTTPTLCTSPTGTATAVATGGTGPYTYTWTSMPAQTGATISGLAAGYYVVNVSDAAGCIQNQSAQVSNNSSLSVAVTTTDAMCGGTPGTATAAAAGGTSPYTYLWNTGNITPGISGLFGGTYSCEVTDQLGCKVSDHGYIITLSPVSAHVTSTPASCIYTADGSAAISISGGATPYTVRWSDGQTGLTASGLLEGQYGAYVTDHNGCGTSDIFPVGYSSTAPCSVMISGDMFDDFDANCALNGYDTYLAGVWVACLPGGGYQWSTDGHYSFTLPPGTYTLYQAPPVYHTLVCPLLPVSQTLTAGQTATINYFYVPDTLRDLAINTIPYTEPRPGFTQHLRTFVRNIGNITQVPTVVYQHAADINFSYSHSAPDIYDPVTHTLTWVMPYLRSTDVGQIDMYFDIPSTLPQGHILNNSDTVYDIVNDVDTNNNFEDVQGVVVASYDPNYIDVLPKGSGTPGYINTTGDTTLRYAVHFQNTGTAAATYVTLKIPIDRNLDISTFQLIGASHAIASITTDAARMLTIRFENINLPDSNADQLGSQGFAAYTFRQKKGLVSGNTINAQANIIFDFNTPVATNTALNTIELGTGIQDVEAGELSLYPNPTQGNVTLDMTALSESRVKVRIIDMMGRVVSELPSAEVPASKRMPIQTVHLATGVYTIEVSGAGRYIQKLVKTDK